MCLQFLTGRASLGRSMIKILCCFLAVLLVLLPLLRVPVKAVASYPDWLVGVLLAVGASLGYKVQASASTNVGEWIIQKLQSFLVRAGYNDIMDWLGRSASDIEANFSWSGEWFGLDFQLYSKVKEFWQSLKISEGVEEGTASYPVSTSIMPAVYVPYTSCTGFQFSQSVQESKRIPVLLDVNDYRDVLISQGAFHGFFLSSVPGSSSSLSLYRFSSSYSLHGFTASILSDSRTYNYYGFLKSRTSNYYFSHSNSDSSYYYFMYSDNSSDARLIPNFDFQPMIVYVYNSASQYHIVLPALIYLNSLGQYCCVYRDYWDYFSDSSPYYMVNPNCLSVVSYGEPYQDFSADDGLVYIDLSEIIDYLSLLSSWGDLTTTILDLIQQDLWDITAALQNLSQSNLPTDTTSFSQLVSSYESLTNQLYAGSITLSSCLGSMYSLLASAIQGVTNPAYCDTLINTYNAFVNKVSLFQGGGGSAASNYPSVAQLASDLNGIYSGLHVVNDGVSILPALYTLPEAVNMGVSLFETAVALASGSEEIVALANVFNAFLETLDFETSSEGGYYQSVIDLSQDLEIDVDRYKAGTQTLFDTLDDMQILYSASIDRATSTGEAACLLSAYKTWLGSLMCFVYGNAVKVSADLSELLDDYFQTEEDILSRFSLDDFRAYLDFENFDFVNQEEASLYNSIWNALTADGAVTKYYIIVPLFLGIVSLILGTTISLSSRKRGK